MSARFDAPLIAGAVVFGDQGLGVLGSVIRANTATGDHGAGLLYNDWDSGDDAKEFRALIVTQPSSGTLFVNENGSYTLAGAADGTHTLTYRLFVDGADLGAATSTFQIGSGAAGAITGQLAATEAIDTLSAAIIARTLVAQMAATEQADTMFGYLPTGQQSPFDDLTPFFAEFAINASWNGQLAKVILNEPTEDILGGRAQSASYTATLPSNVFQGISRGAIVQIGALTYRVNEVRTLSDGALKRLTLGRQ